MRPSSMAFQSHGELVHYAMDVFKPLHERMSADGTVTLTGLKFAKPQPSREEIERIKANREARTLDAAHEEALEAHEEHFFMSLFGQVD